MVDEKQTVYDSLAQLNRFLSHFHVQLHNEYCHSVARAKFNTFKLFMISIQQTKALRTHKNERIENFLNHIYHQD